MYDIIYFSRGGNTKTIATAIGEELSVRARHIRTVESLPEGTDIFLGSGLYFMRPSKQIREFIRNNDFRGKKVAIFGTSTSGIGIETKGMEWLLKRKAPSLPANTIVPGDSSFALPGNSFISVKGDHLMKTWKKPGYLRVRPEMNSKSIRKRHMKIEYWHACNKEKKIRVLLNGTIREILAIALILLPGACVFACSGGNQGGSALPANEGEEAMANKILTQNISEPLNEAKGAKIDINCGTGDLTIDKLNAGDQALAKGTLQYLQNQGPPTQSLNTSDDQAMFTLKAGDMISSGFRFPWAACGGAYEWQIQLNPTVPSDMAVLSVGGNVKLTLAGMNVTRLSVDTGGGNLDVALPDNSVNLTAIAKTGGGNVNLEVGDGNTGDNIITANSGAGNVVVRLPNGISARVYASTGVGKVTVDPRFVKTGKDTYQSAGYEDAAIRFDITARSGAGNVSITIK